MSWIWNGIFQKENIKTSSEKSQAHLRERCNIFNNAYKNQYKIKQINLYISQVLFERLSPEEFLFNAKQYYKEPKILRPL